MNLSKEEIAVLLEAIKSYKKNFALSGVAEKNLSEAYNKLEKHLSFIRS
jgi:exonuclease VII small subunit